MVDISSYSTVEIPGVSPEFLFSWYSEIIENEGLKLGEISIVVCSEPEILEINKQYLNHDYYTDIITFDYVEEDIVCGDLFVCIDTIRSNAELFSSPFDKEMLRVLCHGVLHLCGYGDKSEKEEKTMRAKEEECLSRVMFHVKHLNGWVPSL